MHYPANAKAGKRVALSFPYLIFMLYLATYRGFHKFHNSAFRETLWVLSFSIETPGKTTLLRKQIFLLLMAKLVF